MSRQNRASLLTKKSTLAGCGFPASDDEPGCRVAGRGDHQGQRPAAVAVTDQEAPFRAASVRVVHHYVAVPRHLAHLPLRDASRTEFVDRCKREPQFRDVGRHDSSLSPERRFVLPQMTTRGRGADPRWDAYLRPTQRPASAKPSTTRARPKPKTQRVTRRPRTPSRPRTRSWRAAGRQPRTRSRRRRTRCPCRRC